MNIGRRMVLGFSVLVILCIIIGIVGIFQINAVNANIKTITNKYLLAVEDSREIKYHGNQMSHLMHEFELGETNGTEIEFDLEVEELNEHLTELDSILPEYSLDLEEIRSHFNYMVNDCKSEETGMFDLFEEAFEDLHWVHESVETWENSLFYIRNNANDNLTIETVNLMLYYRDVEEHAMHEYILNRDGSAGTDTITEAEAEFSNLIPTLKNDANASLTAEIDTLLYWHERIDGESAVDRILELIIHYNLAWEESEDLEENYEEMSEHLEDLVVQIDASVDQSVNNANLAVFTALTVNIITLCIAIGLGIAIATPTVRGIVKVTRNMESVLKTGTEVSVNVSNMATELAASSSEVNAASEEIASTTQEVSMNTQGQVNSLVEISKMSNNINELAHGMKKSTEDIKRVMELITSISDQTNLLALNASIEAGRAGEHGRGFAVVADEVRKLAEESKSAVDETAKEVKNITNRIGETVELIGGITQDIESATAAGEENSRALEGISASSEQQTASMEEITSTANKLGVLAEDLKSELAKSETGNGKVKKSKEKILKVRTPFKKPKQTETYEE